MNLQNYLTNIGLITYKEQRSFFDENTIATIKRRESMKKILSFTVIIFCLLFPAFLIAKATAASGRFVPMTRFNTCGGDMVINHFLYDKTTNTMSTVKNNCMTSPMLGSLNIGETRIVYAETDPEDNHEYINVYDIASKTTTTIYDLLDTVNDDFVAYFDKNDKIIFNGDGTLRMMDADGKNITTIAEPESPYSFNMFWLSPDREKIIVVAFRRQGDDYHIGNYERLMMMNSDGTGRQTIGEEYLGEWNQLAWRLDSKEVFFYHHIFNIVEGTYQGKTPQYFLIDLSGGAPGITDLSNLDGWKNKEENACFFTQSGNLLSFFDPMLYNGQTGALISVRPDVPTFMDAMFGIDNSGDIYFADLNGSNFRMFVEFPASTHPLTVNKTGNGSITSLPTGIDCGSACSSAYDQGTIVTLTATPDNGSIFVGWSGGGCSGTGSCVITLNADTSVTATFAAVQTGTPKISAGPKSLNFGSVGIGSTSSLKPITVKNRGKGYLTIDSITIAGANADEFNATSDCTSLAPGTSCSINASFVPASSLGKRSATINISSNDLKSPTIYVKLSGQTIPRNTMEGTYDVNGKMTGKVSIKGHKSQTQRTPFADEFTFYDDGSFAMLDMDGTWIQNGSGFIVTLDPESVSDYFASTISDEIGYDVSVEVTQMNFTGKKQKNGTIKGTIKLNLTFYVEDYGDISGNVTVSSSYTGRQISTQSIKSSMEEKKASPLRGSILNVIQQKMNNAVRSFDRVP